MTLYIFCLVLGLCLLVWSADKFVSGASSVANHFGMSPLLIGMIVIGFGTSAPEMVVSALSSFQGNPGIALGNAYGSNITNIALILGVTALIKPISIHSQVLKKELPILTVVTILTLGLLIDLNLSRLDAVILLIVFTALMFWTIKQGLTNSKDQFAIEVEIEVDRKIIPIKKSISILVFGLLVLIISSRLLVYGAVGIATIFGVSDMIIGLTVVAVGTSLPELASSVIAARKGESDIALGNVLGSNLFNTLAVVGISGIIAPAVINKEVLYRDIVLMTFLTVSIFIFGITFRTKVPRVNRYEGVVLLTVYAGYTVYLIKTVV